MLRPVIGGLIVLRGVRFTSASTAVRGRPTMADLTVLLGNRLRSCRVRGASRFFGAVLGIRGFFHGRRGHPGRRRCHRGWGCGLIHSLGCGVALWCGSGVVRRGMLLGLRRARTNSGAAGNAEAALEAVHTGRDAACGVVRGGQEDARAQQLQVELRRGGPGHLVECGVGDVSGA